MDTTTIMHWMQAVPFFSPFNRNELEKLASDQRYFYKYSEGDKIIEEGQTDVSFHVLLKGAVRITKTVKNREVLINKLKEGSVFGELSILRKGKRTSTVIADAMSITMSIKPKNMDDWMFTCKTNEVTIVTPKFRHSGNSQEFKILKQRLS